MTDRRSRCVHAVGKLINRGRRNVLSAFEETPEQAAYREAFEREASSAVAEAWELETLIDHVAGAEVLLCGAFHSCHEVPRALTRLLERLPPAPGGELLVLPFVREARREELEAVEDGNLDPVELVEELDELDPWPFDRETYLPLLEVAAKRGMHLVGHGDVPPGSGPMARAEADAAVIRARLEEREVGRIVAVVGEHHLARDHLPARLGEALGREPDRWPRLVHTAAAAFVTLEKEGDAPAAALLESGQIAVFAVAPYRLFESFESWRHDAPELPFPLRDPWRTANEPDLPGVLERVAGLMAERMGVDMEGLGARPWGELITPEHLDELAELPLDDHGLDEVLSQLEHGRGYYLPSVPAVILGGASAGPAAEEIAHAWNFALTHPPRTGLPPAEDLRARILREAVGFYGSLALVPDRPFWHPEVDGDAPGGTLLGDLQEMVREALENSMEFPEEQVAELYEENLEGYLGLAHLAGYMLGGSWPREPEYAARILHLGPGETPEELAASWRLAWELAAAD